MSVWITPGKPPTGSRDRVPAAGGKRESPENLRFSGRGVGGSAPDKLLPAQMKVPPGDPPAPEHKKNAETEIADLMYFSCVPSRARALTCAGDRIHKSEIWESGRRETHISEHATPSCAPQRRAGTGYFI